MFTDTAPYGTAGGITTILDIYRETGLGGAPITTELVSRFGMGQEVARRVVLSLRLLDLIDEDGQPTASLLGFKRAPSGDYKRIFADLLLDAYSQVFAILGNDFGNKTPTQIEDAFRTFRPDSLRKRMVTCFLGLCEYAGLVEHAPAKKPGPKTGGQTRVERTPRREQQRRPEKDTSSSQVAGTLDAARQRYLDLLITKAEASESPDQDLLDRIERALGITGGSS